MSVTLNTNLGSLKIEVFCDLCPISAKNFLALCANGYYDGVVFHRSVPGFMIQGGDPSGTGKKGESIFGHPFGDEITDELKHDRKGVVSWANSGPNTNGSQFYITYDKASHLNNISTIFGRVIHGFDTLKKMEKTKTDDSYRPLDDIHIENVVIHANPLA
uniref:Peptidyl-prolyl cis-trans isomerase n=1 Tax=Hirondellea gigas TaxID=1518452 RepID=A0A2R5L1Z1_9CRUS